MRKLILIAYMALFIFSGCHTRKVAVVKSDSVFVNHREVKRDSIISHIDAIINSKKDSTVIIKSGTTTITESGIFENGTLNGSGIKTIVKTHRSKKIQTDNEIDKSAIIDHSEIKSDSLASDSTTIKSKSKVISNTINYWWVLGLISAAIIGWLKFKK